MKTLCIALTTTVALSGNAIGAPGRNTPSSPAAAVQAAKQNQVTRVVHGTLEKVDAGAKTIAMKTAEGGEVLVHFTDRTVVHGIEKGGNVAALEGRKGAHIVVHYAEAGAGATARKAGRAGEKTAEAVVFVGDKTLSVAKGTITEVDRAAKTVAVDTGKGTREVFRLAEECTINTGRGIERAIAASGRALNKGGRAVLYYTEEGGQKVVHAIDAAAHGR